MRLNSDNRIFTATAAEITAEGVTLILPGQTEATRKAYKRLAGATVTAGSQVLCARDSGTIVVLGNIS
jgi:hypothetical protein